MGTKRSRSGCWTCRSRHQKCDETKPACLNCRIRGAECGGYGIRLAEFTVRGDGQMVSKVTRGGPRLSKDRDRNPNKKPKHRESEAGDVECASNATQDISHRGTPINDGSVPSSSPGVDSTNPPPNPKANLESNLGVAREEYLTQIADHISTSSHHSIANLSPERSDESQINSATQDSAAGVHEVTQDAEDTWQSQGDLDTYDDVVLQFSGDVAHIPSLDLEAVIGSLAVHADPVDHFTDDPALDFGLDPAEDDQEEGELGFDDAEEPRAADRILSWFSGSSSLPPTLSDPFEQYLFCHYMENLSMCLYPIRPDLNPYREIYGALAARSSPLRSTIMFASAFHLANLGRLPKFAIQPYRKAMREAFRKALAAETDIEGLAATALLSVVFDVIGTGLDAWSSKLVGCRRLLESAILRSNGTVGASLQCMVVQYNWAAVMSRTLLRDVKPKDVIDELSTVVRASDLQLADDERTQGAKSQSLWWHNLPDHTMHLMLREATDLASQIHHLKVTCSPVDDILQLMPQAGDLVERLKNWDPDVSMVDLEFVDSVEHFNAIWQQGMLCFVYHEIYALRSEDMRIQTCVDAAIEPLKKLSWLQACLFPLFMLLVHAQTHEARSAAENALAKMHSSLAFQTPFSMLLSLKNIWEFSDSHGAGNSKWRDLVKNLSIELNILL
ncbi:Hypothetical protein NCS54_00885100 [Fusarium falciforme]|nr:Hypothetical protein NCS54_00885100 [Fusarium falciforme]WAO91384.1 Hypothetical protein NCS54_00885100 [Fusarium falciforme]